MKNSVSVTLNSEQCQAFSGKLSTNPKPAGKIPTNHRLRWDMEKLRALPPE